MLESLCAGSSLTLLVLWIHFWVVVVHGCRSVTSSRKNAASLVSLTFCTVAVLFGATVLLTEELPVDALTWPLHISFSSPSFSSAAYAREHPELGVAVAARHQCPPSLPQLNLAALKPIHASPDLSEGPWMGIREFIVFSVAYFSTDLYYDWDPRFVTHHLLSLSAMATTWMFPFLQGSFSLTAFIAEIGGVVYHLSKLVQRPWMTMTFLYVYAFTRVVMFPAFLAWLLRSLWANFQWVKLWATGGTCLLVFINISWCRKQWLRFHPAFQGRHMAPTVGESDNLSLTASTASPLAAAPAEEGGGVDRSAFTSEGEEGHLGAVSDRTAALPGGHLLDELGRFEPATLPAPDSAPLAVAWLRNAAQVGLEYARVIWDLMS